MDMVNTINELSQMVSTLQTAVINFREDSKVVKETVKELEHPFGVYSSLGQGYNGDYFNLLTTGSREGLTSTKGT